MYVGHGLLAIALGGSLGRALGLSRERSLALALVSGGFALVPDVDMARTAIAVAAAGPGPIFPTTQYVWTQSWVVHRSLTHSLISAGLVVLLVTGTTALIGGWSHRSAPRRAALLGSVLGPVAALLWIARSSDALLGVAIIGIYLAAAFLVTVVAARREVPSLHVGLAALIGLGSHPFGDFWMGTPPSVLYPLVRTPPIETVVFSAEPTVNLLTLFLIEVALGWAALAVLADLTGRSLLGHVKPHAVLGVGFAAALPFVPPPTLELAYQFAIGTIATGVLLGVVPVAWPNRGFRRAGGDAGYDRRFAMLVTALAGVAAALIGYLAAYLLIGV